MTEGKGHVPEENLTRYRALASIARQFDTLGNAQSNIGEYAMANQSWRNSRYYWHMANELRADLPADEAAAE